jgi:hypothetical protein
LKVGLRISVDDYNYAEIALEVGYIVGVFVVDGVETTESASTSSANAHLSIQRLGTHVELTYDDGSGWTTLMSIDSFPTDVATLKIFGWADSGETLSGSFNSFSLSDAINALATPDFVKEPGTPWVQIGKQGHRALKNYSVASFSNRYKLDGEYTVDTEEADDLTDIDKFGRQDQQVDLSGFCKRERAAKMIWYFLRKSLFNPRSIVFKLGPKAKGPSGAEGIKAGVIRYLSDKDSGLSNIPARILTISERPLQDGHVLEVEALEETGINPDAVLPDTGAETGLPIITPSPPVTTELLPVVRPTVFEIPAMYSQGGPPIAIAFSKPGAMLWIGATVYEAYSLTGTYTQIAVINTAGITGKVASVSPGDSPSITVTLDYDDTLVAVADLDYLLTHPGENTGVVFTASGMHYFRYVNATLTGTPRVWELSGLMWDISDWPNLNQYGDVITDDVVVLNVPYYAPEGASDKNRTLYFKLASMNSNGDVQDLTDAAAANLLTQALSDKPLKPGDIAINGITLDQEDGSIILDAGDLLITWISRNRLSNGIYVYDRADACKDDTDFVTFILEIYYLTTLLRTVNQTGKSFTYTGAMQTTDGGPFSAYIFKLKQEGTLAFSDQVTANVSLV